MGWFFKSSPNLSQKLDRLVYEWVTFSWKIGICMGLLSNSVVAHPYQNQTWVPPGPLTTGQMKRSPWALFYGWPKPTHWHSQFCWKKALQNWPFNSDPNDPKMTSDQKLLNTLKEPLAKNLFTQISSKSIELCRRKSILSIFERPQITPRWHPYCSLWWSLYPSITKIHQGILFVKHFLIVHTKIDRCISMSLHPT